MRDRSAPLSAADIEGLAWEKMGGLVPAVVQDVNGGAVLMLGYMDQAALRATLESGLATFFSRSRGELWQKGRTSGNLLRVEAVHTDCDGDALLVLARPQGPTCHLGTRSCFPAAPDGPGWLATLAAVIRERASTGSADSYTARLVSDGPVRIAQKVGEEGVEVALAAVVDDGQALAPEIADLLYHLSVLMHVRRVDWSDVVQVLQERHAGTSVSDA